MPKKSDIKNVDFKETLWKSADKLRNKMDAAEYKHIVLGLIFLKYISDKFYAQRIKTSKNYLQILKVIFLLMILKILKKN